jgi:hypothetical protein
MSVLVVIFDRLISTACLTAAVEGFGLGISEADGFEALDRLVRVEGADHASLK